LSLTAFGRSATPILAAALILLASPAPRTAPAALTQVDDAYISEDARGLGWTIGNADFQYSLGQENGAIVVRALQDVAGDRDWHRANAPDARLTIGGTPIAIGAASTPFASAETSEWHGGVRLDLHFSAPSTMRLTRSYVVYPQSPLVEMWTTVENVGKRTVDVGQLNAFTLSVEAGAFGWLLGMDAPDQAGGPFTRLEGDLDEGRLFELGSAPRASEQTVPFFTVRTADDRRLFGATIWSGAWRLTATRHGGVVDVGMGLPPLTTSLTRGASLELPHAVIGVTTPAQPEVSIALRSFVDRGLRGGRPFSTHVTFNTWYAFGTFIDESSLFAEMALAAEMGVEQFVVDAGWWAGVNGDERGDFERGWGAWTVDADRFPNGLGALRDRAHELGLRFGVWVEPERVALETVNRPGLARERTLATADDLYEPWTSNSDARSAQICLADGEGFQWVSERLAAFIDEVRPDYLKWDNNLWVDCNRSGHGHGAEDGNLRHHLALGQLRQSLRDRYPDLQVEECASGGHRLSLAALATSDAIWLDDRTGPSLRVRHHLVGLLELLPAPSLLSFVLSAENEPIADDPSFDLPLVARSRMLGALGLSVRPSDMGEGTRAVLSREIALYKAMRPLLDDSDALPLGPQPIARPEQPWAGWDAVEYRSRTTGNAVVMAFDAPDAPDRIRVRLRGLRADAEYDMESADYGPIGSATGADLMLDGVEILASGISHAHVMFFRMRQPPESRPR
jgi:alpha-galactosidase